MIQKDRKSGVKPIFFISLFEKDNVSNTGEVDVRGLPALWLRRRRWTPMYGQPEGYDKL